uniref:Uncharacterized protein n=1 Tax=Arundo donax TaxID=35708 RepID=A0A0A9D0W9_ARUDO
MTRQFNPVAAGSHARHPGSGESTREKRHEAADGEVGRETQRPRGQGATRGGSIWGSASLPIPTRASDS